MDMSSRTKALSRRSLLVALLLLAVIPAVSAAQPPAPDVVTGSLSVAPVWPSLGLSASVPAVAARAGRRRWYAFPTTAFLAPENILGARLVGMVIDLNDQDQPASRCSGTVVSSPNGSVVWTAGHCILNREDSPTPFPHIEFVPGAEAGPAPFTPTAPYGVWPAVAYAMTSNWARHGSARQFRSDLGALLIARDPQGATLSQALGGADRISFRGTTSVRTEVLGYPELGRFAGNDSLIGCGPRPTGRAWREGGSGAAPLVIACSMTPGSSGGPWLTHVNAAGVGTVISATSSTNGPSTRLYGAVQGRVARRVWADLARRHVP